MQINQILMNCTKKLNDLKHKIDKLDIGKLEMTPVDLSKLSNILTNDIVKKDLCNAKIKKY